jgi:5-(carboxyamino)imidazole ribonucleotide mutase
MVAALTPLPVLGVPVQSRTLSGVDSLLSIVQMPAGMLYNEEGEGRGKKKEEKEGAKMIGEEK